MLVSPVLAVNVFGVQMHAEAWSFLQSQVSNVFPTSIIDVGGQNVNGTPRDLWPNAEYTALDYVAGVGVDIVADATKWIPDRKWSMGLCTEMFEHVPPTHYRPILERLGKAVVSGGPLLLTCATDPRPMHAAWGGEMQPNEFYQNVEPIELLNAFNDTGWKVIDFIVNPNPGDIYVRATNLN